jgi:hypothetical protein
MTVNIPFTLFIFTGYGFLYCIAYAVFFWFMVSGFIRSQLKQTGATLFRHTGINILEKVGVTQS